MTILVLAGTSEARILLAQLFTRDDVVASLAGETRAPVDLGVRTRIGGFGGVDGFSNYLIKNQITAVIDATHPFAEIMTQTAFDVCRNLEIPHIILQRKQWVAGINDDWHRVDYIKEISKIIKVGQTVFLGTGRKTLHEYECLDGCRLLARVIDPPSKPFPFKNGSYLIGKPPFSVEEEMELFKREQIDWLVVKNSGGEASKSKLVAAAHLGLPVAMINRPTLPKADLIHTVPDCVTWLERIGL